MPRRQDPTAGPRAAMIGSAVALMRERGVAATSFADVLARSGAPRGSIYHHFPRGKAQLIEDATRSAAEQLDASIGRILAANDTVGTIRTLVDIWGRRLQTSDYVSGCPIAAAALGTEPGAREIAGVAFDTWCAAITGKLVAEGVAPGRARSLAVLIISSLEGAVIVAQAQGGSGPLDAVVVELEHACRAALSPRPPHLPGGADPHP
ncbi:TetR/AcrR family transcriptional regulator [Rhodococcus sp. NPDC058505]|uniref:TetR/AcrR family transcriptional regulator n=1 Tax=unclassified Rhodococcus (in: high G+C Gram-positive bacteria) TaxID=192944 RepID=UPI00364A5B0B